MALKKSKCFLLKRKSLLSLSIVLGSALLLALASNAVLSKVSESGKTNVTSDLTAEAEAITASYYYTKDTTPVSLSSNDVRHIYKVPNTNLMYVSLYTNHEKGTANYDKGEVALIDTNGTVDPSDDAKILSYNESSNPPLAENFSIYNQDYYYYNPYQTFLDGNLLYIAMRANSVNPSYGLSVIDTKGTLTDISDDENLTTYTLVTTMPPTVDGYEKFQYILPGDVRQFWINDKTDQIYVDTGLAGLSVIDRNGTVDPSDDTVSMTYDRNSTPAIEERNITDFYFDETTDLIYVSTFNLDDIWIDPQADGGLVVINTQGTADSSDDTSYVYDKNTFPSLPSYLINSVEVKNGLIYVSTFDGCDPEDCLNTPYEGGLWVIDTNSTPYDQSDDVLLGGYNTTSSPAIGSDYIGLSLMDETTGTLYIGTEIRGGTQGAGVFEIDTKGTKTLSDDTLTATYDVDSTPALSGNVIKDLWLDEVNNALYVGASSFYYYNFIYDNLPDYVDPRLAMNAGGLTVLQRDVALKSSSFTSSTVTFNTQEDNLINLDTKSITNGIFESLEYRTGTAPLTSTTEELQALSQSTSWSPWSDTCTELPCRVKGGNKDDNVMQYKVNFKAVDPDKIESIDIETCKNNKDCKVKTNCGHKGC